MPFAKLDQDRIVAEALALLNEEGLAQVSLRKVATRLGVGVSSLYWHVEDKSALYRLMSGRVFRACLEAVPPADDWRIWLRDFAHALWQAQLTVRDAHQLIAQAPRNEADNGRTRADIVGRLAAMGLDPAIAAPAQLSIQALVTGWTTLHARPGGGLDQDAFRAALDALIAGWEAKAGQFSRSG